MTAPRLGVVADDVTGACDLGDAVRDAGASVVVVLGVPDPGLDLPPCDCAVVALRTRTAPNHVAVAESTAAARWLLDHGTEALYQKYCSTFDSLDDGTIGPVADALLGVLGPGAVSVGTPATPRAGRTMYQGHLFVGDRLLSESSLRHHPLTPMRDPDLVRVLGRQTPGRVGHLPWAVLRSAGSAAALAALVTGGAEHILADALVDDDLDALARAVDDVRAASGRTASVLMGGAAGFASAIARSWGRPGRADAVSGPENGRALILSGSCSARTLEQVARFDGPRIDLDAATLDAEPDTAIDVILDRLSAAYGHGAGPVLVSSSAEPGSVQATQERLGAQRAADLLERAAGEVAARAVADLGVRRLLVAGGETSGAVAAAALGLRVLRVGPAAAAGVPWMVPVGGPPIAVLLKSGNFGGPELFRTAWESCP